MTSQFSQLYPESCTISLLCASSYVWLMYLPSNQDFNKIKFPFKLSLSYYTNIRTIPLSGKEALNWRDKGRRYVWPFKGFLSGGLGERSGIRWSCLVWRHAPVAGVRPGCVGVCVLWGTLPVLTGTGDGSVMGSWPQGNLLPVGLPEMFESGICNCFEAWRTFILLIFLLPLNIFLRC